MVFSLKKAGMGYQRIAKELDALNIATSRGSVFRLIKGLPPYGHALESLVDKPSAMVTTR